jgi:hypothetical protein
LWRSVARNELLGKLGFRLLDFCAILTNDLQLLYGIAPERVDKVILAVVIDFHISESGLFEND